MPLEEEVAGGEQAGGVEERVGVGVGVGGGRGEGRDGGGARAVGHLLRSLYKPEGSWFRY